MSKSIFINEFLSLYGKVRYKFLLPRMWQNMNNHCRQPGLLTNPCP
jgi:hypothetical protein